MGFKEAIVVGSVFWRMFMEALKGHDILLICEAPKGHESRLLQI